MTSLNRYKPAERYGKCELDELIDRVKEGDVDAIDEAVVFTIAETRGYWHGRARAKICRNLKNRSLSQSQVGAMAEAICRRLSKGNFAEQFKDQLRFAIRRAPVEMRVCAERSLSSTKTHVRRYADWVLERSQT